MEDYKIKDLERELFKIGIKEQTYNEFWTAWVKDYGDNIQSKKDYIWHCLNLLLHEWAKQSTSLEMMYRQQRKVYAAMIMFRRYEDKKPNNIRKAFNFCDLQIQKLSGYNVTVFIIDPRDCEQGRKINNIQMSLDEAIKNQPIPDKNCKRFGGCICCYGFRMVKD